MQVIEWRQGFLRYLDQTKLPLQEAVVETDDPAVVLSALSTLAIRGAPLIGIAAAYGLALAVSRGDAADSSALRDAFHAWARRFVQVRPTAVNLRWAVERMEKVLERHVTGDAETVRRALVQEALRIHEEDRLTCDAIARHGVELLTAGARILTHCNTGALATGGVGTALGVITRGWKEGKVALVYVDETRPLLQGARLTSWELTREGVPMQLIADSTAGFLFRQGRVDAVIVGADRIARNGDVVNKIGTYGLAVLAAHHGIPFYVAAPTSTIDLKAETGHTIPIEERSPSELTEWDGRRLAPAGVAAYAPAFDLTPAELVTALVTEHGVMRSPSAEALSALPMSGGNTT